MVKKAFARAQRLQVTPRFAKSCAYTQNLAA